MKTDDKDRIIQKYIQGYRETLKLKNEIQQAEDRFVKAHIKAFFVCWAIFVFAFIIYCVWHNKD